MNLQILRKMKVLIDLKVLNMLLLIHQSLLSLKVALKMKYNRVNGRP